MAMSPQQAFPCGIANGVPWDNRPAVPLVIFGAGHLGKQVFEGVRKAGYSPIAYVDNDAAKHGTQLNGLPILHPNVLEDCTKPVLIAIHNNTSVKPQLAELNCKAVTYVEMFRQHAECFPEEKRMAGTPAFVARLAELPELTLRRAHDLLADERSRLEFHGLVEWHGGNNIELLPHSPASETYFPPDLFKPTDHEVFVDCGAYDGDTIAAFLQKTDGAFWSIYAFEPDFLNFSKLQQRTLFTIIKKPWAVGKENSVIPFLADGSAGAHVDEKALHNVQVVTLDSALPEFPPPTIIKMDIEGSEADALQGAAQLIAQHKPILAIAAYHHYWDLWELPLLIHKLSPDYKIFLRRYAEDCWETVYYAIPPERCLVK
jgi:FkbM family methyltransferase